jgi:hypothetical protein
MRRVHPSASALCLHTRCQSRSHQQEAGPKALLCLGPQQLAGRIWSHQRPFTSWVKKKTGKVQVETPIYDWSIALNTFQLQYSNSKQDLFLTNIFCLKFYRCLSLSVLGVVEKHIQYPRFSPFHPHFRRLNVSWSMWLMFVWNAPQLWLDLLPHFTGKKKSSQVCGYSNPKKVQ